MHHANDIDLIELIAGRLDPAQAKAISAHVDACPDCRRKLEQVRRTWDVLGSWSIEVPPGLSVLKAPTQPRREVRLLRLPIFRVAASIAVAAILGYAGGWWSNRPSRTVAPLNPPAYLSALASPAGERLALLVLSDTSSSGEGG